MCLHQYSNGQSPISTAWSHLMHQLNHFDCNTTVHALVGSGAVLLMSRDHYECLMDHILCLLPWKVAVECLCLLIVCSLSLFTIELQRTSVCWYDQPNHRESNINRFYTYQLASVMEDFSALDDVRRCTCPTCYYLLKIDLRKCVVWTKGVCPVPKIDVYTNLWCICATAVANRADRYPKEAVHLWTCWVFLASSQRFWTYDHNKLRKSEWNYQPLKMGLIQI